jgi:hypothetical protein
MNRRIQKLVLAAVLASSVPAAALARDCDHDGDHDRDDRPPAAYAPPYEAPVAPPAYYAPAYRPGYRAPAPDQWREARWRERELTQLRLEYRALDDERARFYAENAYRPGKLRRFERSYAARRAELDRRWNALQVVAWR